MTLQAAVEVAEINGKTKQQSAPQETRTRDKKSKGGKGSGGGKGKGDTDKSDKTCWLFKQGKCTYGKDCKFKHKAGASKGASVRQLSVEALENSTKVTLPMAGHEGEGWSIGRPRRTYKNALHRAAQALEAPERSSAMMYAKGCDTIYRVLEDVTETLSKTRRCAMHRSAEKLTGVHGYSAEHGLVRIDRRSRPNEQCGAEALWMTPTQSAEPPWELERHIQNARPYPKRTWGISKNETAKKTAYPNRIWGMSEISVAYPKRIWGISKTSVECAVIPSRAPWEDAGGGEDPPCGTCGTCKLPCASLEDTSGGEHPPCGTCGTCERGDTKSFAWHGKGRVGTCGARGRLMQDAPGSSEVWEVAPWCSSAG